MVNTNVLMFLIAARWLLTSFLIDINLDLYVFFGKLIILWANIANWVNHHPEAYIFNTILKNTYNKMQTPHKRKTKTLIDIYCLNQHYPFFFNSESLKIRVKDCALICSILTYYQNRLVCILIKVVLEWLQKKFELTPQARNQAIS